MEKVHETIEKRVNRKVPGKLILPADFRGIGTNDAIKKALSRLAKAGTIKRLAHGIYFKPKIDPLFGEVYPGAESIARMLAEKTRVHIKPTGAAALNKLGLSTQVPTKLYILPTEHQKRSCWEKWLSSSRRLPTASWL